MKRKINFLLISVLMFSGLVFFVTKNYSFARETNKKIVIGDSVKIKSKVLNEERELFIYLPEGYHQSKEKYPVLYKLDGHLGFKYTTGIIDHFQHFGRMPQMILIGILNTDRNRDFTPTKYNIPTGGGADNFLKFMKDELIPFIDKNYRTQPYRILSGHSLCGMFAIYALLVQPNLFSAYIATSPSLWWDGRTVLKKAEGIFDKQSNLKKFLFINFGGGDSEHIKASTWAFAQLLERKAPQDLEWKVVFSEKEDHVTIPILSFPDGLEVLYKDWEVPGDVLTKGVEALQVHFKLLSKKFGYEIPVAESAYNKLGYKLMNEGKLEEALDIFKLNVKLHPDSWNIYDSLGEAYMKSSNRELAIKNYKKSLELNPLNHNAFGMLNRLKEKNESVLPSLETTLVNI